MNRRIIVISLLVTALCFALPSIQNANSQSSFATTTVTIKQSTSGQCTVRSLAFSGVKDDEIMGTYGSDTQIGLYILTQDDLNSIQNCRVPTTAKPLFAMENAIGHGIGYRSLPFPANATYYLVLIYANDQTSGDATVEFSFQTSIIFNDTIGSSNTTATTISSSNTTATTINSSNMTTTTIILPTSVTSNSSSQAGSLVAIGNLGAVGAIALVVVIAMVGSVALLMRRKKSSMKNAVTATVEKLPQNVEPVDQATHPTFIDRLSTGYGDLDNLLTGGLPKRHAVLLISPPCDERDPLLRKIIGSALSTSMPTFYLSNDPSNTQDMIRTHSKDFFALSPQADKILPPPANLYKIPDINSLSGINEAFTKMMDEHVNQRTGNRLLIFDLLTDILTLKGVKAGNWFSDFVARRKAEGFTVLAFLNPLVASSKEIQILSDLFDGVIEIYEKEIKEMPRRFLVIKRMYGQRPSESELMLDKDKLF
jgi:hypothetical protein